MRADLVSDVLRVVRVGGALVLHDTYRAPWAVSIPSSNELSQLVRSQQADRVVAFHFVEHGWLDVTDTERQTRRVVAGELIVGFGGTPHDLRRGDCARAQPVAAIMNTKPGEPRRGLGDEDTRLLCGVFVLEHLNRTPLLCALPELIRLPADQGGALSRLTAQLAHEATHQRPGSTFMISRLLEMLLAEALRQTVDRGIDKPNWLAALNDPIVWTALQAVHADPGAPWTVEALAGVAAISPSRLTARFRRALYESPMSYVARWRMVTASNLLDSTDMSVERVGLAVGYSNQPAFTRAFRRHHGVAPRAWRSQQRV